MRCATSDPVSRLEPLAGSSASPVLARVFVHDAILKSTPGHTPGHQSLFVALANTGPVVLGGDLYHFPSERTFNTMPTREAAEGQTSASREALESFMEETGATLWIQHDIVQFGLMELAPDYYD